MGLCYHSRRLHPIYLLLVVCTVIAPAKLQAQVLDTSVEVSLSARERLAQAHTFEQAKQYSEAIAAYRDYLAVRSEDDEARGSLAKLLAWEGHYSEAITLYQDILTRHPVDYDIRTALARVLSWQKKFEKAQLIYERVLHEDPDNAEALRGLADVLFWKDHKSEALFYYERVYAINKDEAIAQRIDTIKAELSSSQPSTILQGKGDLHLPYRDYLKIGYTHYTYTEQIPDERDFLIEGATSVDEITFVARVEHMNRFDFHDTPVSGEVYSPLWDKAWGYLALLGTVNPNFAPNFSVAGEVMQGLGIFHSAFSSVEASFGYRRSRYPSEDEGINILTPGFTFYLPYNIWLTEKSFYVPKTGAITLSSQLTWRVKDRVQLSASGSFGTASERIVATQDFTRVNTRIIHGKATFPLTDWLSGEADVYYEDRETLYVRRGGTFNLIFHW